MQTQRSNTVFKLAASAFTLGASLTACQSSNSPAAHVNTAIGSVDAPQPSIVLIKQAEAARLAGNPAAAISFAELAVTADPQNADARFALAKAYTAAGRYQSSAEAYGDLSAMNPADANVRFRAALSSLAAGNRYTALSTLDALAGDPSLTADVGLALALSGESRKAISLLEAAVRAGDSTPRLRQNLALAQALSGEWAAARTTASMDLTPDAVDARVAEWAAIASNTDSAWRTASVLGVQTAANDAGRPVALAWAPPHQVQAVAIAAAAEPAPAVSVEAAPVTIARAEVPIAAEPAQPIVQIRAVQPAFETLKPVAAVKREIRALAKPSHGAWVVQLGSYAKPEFLNAGWKTLIRKNSALGEFEPIRSEIEVKGATYHRLAIGSFVNVTDAVDLCRNLKSEGYSCFVRKGASAATSSKKA
ncbi:SPOR domain-containing protein [Sphingosinicella soli]|uniref:Flp pilus assembly protein TadD n=1 Tax=Sphingosinicella soli TaxID=333708 RepID=A0A7W7B0C2_9SPHN|nr:SPOR domain-containing protein [Sphingosinicella soli]MBB4630630.1 Flp pilus assembly protein TadD [Sphingosinicella soli]